MVNPFQFVFKLTNKVSQPARAMASDLEDLADVSESLEETWGEIKTLALGALGFFTLKEAIEVTTEAAKELDSTITSLANSLGSDQLAENQMRWINDIRTQLPIAREELLEVAKTYGRLGQDVRALDVESLFAISQGLGENIGTMESTFRDLSFQFRLTIDDFYTLNQQYGITRKEFAQMTTAMAGTTRGSISRMNAMLGVLGTKYADTVERTATSIEGLQQRIGGYLLRFKEQLLGDRDTGVMGFIRESYQSIVQFFERNAPRIEAIARSVGRLINVIFRGIRDLSKLISGRVSNMFDDLARQSRDFEKDVVLPAITFFEIIRVKSMAFINGFLDGFLDSPVWDAFGLAFKGIGKILGTFTVDMESLGRVIGFVVSGFTAMLIVKKVGAAVMAATNPVYLFTAAVIGLTYALDQRYDLFNRQRKMIQGYQNDMIVSYEREQRAVNDLYDTIKDATKSDAERVSALEQLRTLYPEALKGIDTIGKALDNEVAIRGKIDKAIFNNIKSRILEQATEEALRDKLKKQQILQDFMQGNMFERMFIMASQGYIAELVNPGVGQAQFMAGMSGDIAEIMARPAQVEAMLTQENMSGYFPSSRQEPKTEIYIDSEPIRKAFIKRITRGGGNVGPVPYGQ